MARVRRLVRALLVVALSLGMCAGADAADRETIGQIRARGVLRCGVGEGIEGFAAQDAAGVWSGLEVDFCRALAAAALGDPDRVRFIRLRAAERFPALEERQLDVLVRNTTWTLLREATLGVQFAGVLFYDRQAFMVRSKDGPRKATALKGATVCVLKDTSSLNHLTSYSAATHLGLRPLVLASAVDARDAFFAGRCAAWTSDVSQLAVARLHAPGGPQSCTILPDELSTEPLGPVVRDGDASWLVLVRWVLVALLRAEQLGVTRANLGQRVRDAAVAAALVPDADVDRGLGVEPGWMVRAIQAAGNYGEMFDRNLGANSPVKLERGLNRIWTDGGLMYAPPVR